MFSFMILFIYLLLNPLNSELSNAISFCHRHPQAVYDIILYGAANSIGQCFIFSTLQDFGSLVLVTVTVTRKMFSILLSVFWFAHSISLGQWGGVLLVFVAIGWEAAGKARSSINMKKKIK